MKKKFTILLITILTGFTLKAQITPTLSPYFQNGTYTVVSDSFNVPTSKKVVMYRPNTPPVGQKYPTLIFQPGANGFGSSAINVHSYDLFMKHLVTYGYVVIVIDATTAGIPNGSDFKKVFSWYKTTVANSTHWLNTYSDSTKVFVGGHSNGGVNASALVASNGSPSQVAGIIYFASYPSNNFLVTQNVSSYNGSVLDLAGDADATTALNDAKTGYNKFTSAQCPTFVSITGADHGAFGDYVNSGQPVGSIGRTNATATIRHYLVSFLETYSKNNLIANNHLNIAANRPTTTTEFINPCAITTNIIDIADANDFSIYPNPSTNYAIIKTNTINNTSIEIINLYGQIIESKNILNKTYADTYHLNTSNLSDGIYLVKIRTEQGESITKYLMVKNNSN